MALTEEIEIGRIEILPMGQIQVRTDTDITKNGVKISRSYKRHMLTPDVSAGDFATQEQRVKNVAHVTQT